MLLKPTLNISGHMYERNIILKNWIVRKKSSIFGVVITGEFSK